MASDWGSLPRELLALVFRHLTGPYHNEEALLPASIALKLVHGALNANRHWREVAQQEVRGSIGVGRQAIVCYCARLASRVLHLCCSYTPLVPAVTCDQHALLCLLVPFRSWS